MVQPALNVAPEIWAAALGGQALEVARLDASALDVAAAENLDELSAHGA